MSTQSINNRIKNIKAALKLKNLDALLITTNPNTYYTTNFTGHDSWTLITPRKTYLLTDSRYTEQAKNQCLNTTIIERKISLIDTAVKIANRNSSIKKIAIEDKTSIAIFHKLRKTLNAKLVESKDVIDTIRETKDPTEAAAVQKAAQIAFTALEKTLKKVKPGITEIALAALLEYNIKQLSSDISFPTIVAFGPAASQPHYQPTNKKLKKNDTTLIDFGAKYNNYISDITRCFTIGKPSKKYIQAYKTVLAAAQAATKTLAPGVKVADVEKAARNVIAQTNFPQFGHGTGHGIGLDVHEMPFISQKIKDKTLAIGNIITIEPGIYISGKLGVRIEDDILITKNGYKILTSNKFKTDLPPTI